jgi:hypothetical protein
MRKKTQAAQTKTPRDVAMELYRKAKRPGATQADISAAITAIEADQDFDLAKLSNIVSMATENLIERLAPEDRFTQECLRRRCANLALELSQPNDGQLERMLIDQIVLCWLRAGTAEQKYTAVTMESCSIKVADHWEKRLSATQKRYTRAVESLARVRKLTRPKVQVGIGTLNAALVNR